MRPDSYWKQAAVCVMALMILLVSGGRAESFAMGGGYQAQAQILNNPNKVIIADDEPAGGSGSGGGSGQAQITNVGADSGQADQARQTSVQGAQASQPAPVTAAFGSVRTAKTDSSSWFGAGRLTMLANHDSTAQNLSVIIETGEGGLIVVDGGWTDNSAYLLNQIKQKGGHVQAWLITHPHSDHVGALADILYNHSGEITIDGIYYSYLEDSWYQEKEPGAFESVNYFKNAFAQAPQEILHGNIVAGQVIEAGPAKIQVLNQAYKTTSDFVNNSSVAYLVSLNGTNVVFLGDMALAGGSQLMADVDLRALGCDMVQMAHHGQNGVGYEVYKALKPKVCLWPTPQWLWDNDNGGGYNSGTWTTLETRNWMVRLGVSATYCTKDGDQVIE